MPQRRRIVFCDCLDCEQQQPGDLPSTSSPAGEAAARQEPPPKCLVVVLSGALRDGGPISGSSSSSSDVSLPHLHRAAAQGGLCLLTVREGTAGEEEAGVAAGVEQQLLQHCPCLLPHSSAAPLHQQLLHICFGAALQHDGRLLWCAVDGCSELAQLLGVHAVRTHER